MRILFVGGTTGGHLTPIKSVKQALEKIGEEMEFFLITEKTKNQDKLLQEIDVKTYFILSGKLRRYFSILNFTDFLKLALGFIQSLWRLFILMPDVIFSRGSSVSVPVGIVAWLFRIPVMIHEADLTPSLTNKILAPYASRIAVSFKETAKYFKPKYKNKIGVTGIPVRQSIFNGDKNQALQHWRLDSKYPVIYVTGGSSGAQVINRAVIGALPLLLDKYQIVLQCGKLLFEETQQMVKELRLGPLEKNFRLIDFAEEKVLADIFSLADLIITRAGGNTIVELALLSKPMILVPLSQEAARGDQLENAFYFEKQGAGVILAQANLTPRLLTQKINDLLANSQAIEKAKQMGKKASSLVYKGADERIAKELVSMGK